MLGRITFHHLTRPLFAATLSLLLAQGPLAQTTQGVNGPLMVPVTEGKGPSEHVTGFKIAPDAEKQRLSSDAVGKLGNALTSHSGALRRGAELNLGIQALGDTQGSFGALGTLAEHALWLDQFGAVNNALNNIGFVMALAQVARDGWNGNDKAAVTGGIKAWMNFAVGRWGTGAMQIGSVAVFVVDITLREWQSGLSEIAHDVQFCHYKAWYKDHPRKVGEWKDAAWALYLAAEKGGGQSYETYIDGMLNEYVARAFADGGLSFYGDCGGSSFGERAYVERLIEAEHKAVLEKMLATKVMPEIGDRAWLRTLRAEVREAETYLMPRLNKAVVLEVTAYGYPGGTRVVMPLPAGGEWAGKLRDNGTFKARLTRYAILKAGFPDSVRIDGPNGPEERKLTLAGDRLTAMFGAPVTPVVARYTLSEGAGSCEIKRIQQDGTSSTEATSAEARGDRPLDVAMLPGGAWVFGQFRTDAGWRVASPGAPNGGTILLGAPLYDNITALDSCKMDFLVADTLAQGTCTVKRFEAKQVSAKVRIERTCTAPARLSLAGIFASVVTGKMQYYPIDGPEGKMIVEVIKQSISKGIEGGGPGAVSGMPLIPGAKP